MRSALPASKCATSFRVAGGQGHAPLARTCLCSKIAAPFGLMGEMERGRPFCGWRAPRSNVSTPSASGIHQSCFLEHNKCLEVKTLCTLRGRLTTLPRLPSAYYGSVPVLPKSLKVTPTSSSVSSSRVRRRPPTFFFPLPDCLFGLVVFGGP